MWLLLALACAPWSDADLDGDGFDRPEDCDDGDPRVNPDAPDPVGDEVDGNCDGLDGVDADGDGEPSQRSGGEDCDDDDPAVFPGAVEVCNGVNDNCEGAVDEGAVDALDFYVDADGDGVGAGPVERFCADPGQGWSAVAGDCGPGDPMVFPGAREPCGQDLDCDGVVSSCTPLAGVVDPSVVWSGPTDGSDAGWSVAAVGDVNGDGRPDLAVGAPGLGVAWILAGPFPEGGALNTHALITLDETGSDQAGISVAGVGDVDGDGRDDVLVGADAGDVGGVNSGGAWLLHGSDGGSGTLTNSAVQLIGEDPGDQGGKSVAGPGDADGDGLPDLLIGAPGHGPGGAVYLFSGDVVNNSSLGSADLELQGPAGAGAGWSVGGADLDGDGLGDLVVGGPMGQGGAVWVVTGSAAGTPQNTVSLDAADGILVGGADGDELGWAVTTGDVDGDGRADLWLGAPGTDDARGAAWLVLGDAQPGGAPVAAADAAFGSVVGLLPGERVGDSLTVVPDIDGDGAGELAVAGYGVGSATPEDGSVWLFVGGGSGTLDVGEGTAWLVGERSGDRLGSALTAGDWNEDGHGDLGIGAPGAGSAGTGSGEVWLIYGG